MGSSARRAEFADIGIALSFGTTGLRRSRVG